MNKSKHLLFYLGLSILLSGLLSTLSHSANANDSWSPRYMVENFKRVGATQISPDGQWVAFTVSEARTEGEKSDFLTHIHLVKSDQSRQFQLTRGDVSATNPQWSPDGSLISFTSSRGGNSNQLWLISPSGGEAWPITAEDGGIGGYQWSKQGDRIAFSMTDPLSDEQKRRQKVKEDMKVVDKNIRQTHLYVLNINPEEETIVEAQRLTEGEFSVGNFDWSPDGTTLAFDHQPRPGLEYAPFTSISTVPSRGGEVSLLVDLGGSDTNPIYSPDGRYLAFTSDDGNHRWPGFDYLKVKDLSNGNIRQLGKTHDDEPKLIQWSADGSEIFYWELHKTSIDLFAMPVTGKDAQYRQITEGPGRFTGFSLSKDNSVMAALHEDFDKPADVVFSSVNNFVPFLLTQINAGYELSPIAHAEVFRYTSHDGMPMEAPLIYPVNYEEGKRYPILLHVHGGPTGVFGETYVGAPGVYPLQKFAEEGYFILRPNFRGSGGYGKDFRMANLSDWGYGDLEDMLTGIDLLIEKGMVDPDRQAIMGWSYGGFMSAFAITRTDRFKASMMGAGVSNLVSMTGTSDIPSFLPDYFGSEYWEDYDKHIRHSAVFNIEKVNTPTLILHPEEDIRVPLSQGYEMYVGLKRRGIDTKMVTYPRQPHGIREPKFIIDAAERQLKWLEKYLPK